ncbi:hypothetical protein [uncultured Algibacter sp.]|uniref:hypothetical protein n=1 Tax=uncultured Algibacter sp. TaxID=298659 RepID=UPI00262E9FC7|nr:hypothetical protein [uncultured Algibacter sp.]
MLEAFKSYLLYGNKFCGIEHTTVNNSEAINVTLLKKTKKEVGIQTTRTSKTVKELNELLPKKQHVFLIVNNDQVLSKIIKNESSTEFNLVNKAFPNINISEFYYEILKQGDTSFISVCRKSYLNELIEIYTKNDLSVIKFSLGNLAITSVVHFSQNDQISTSNSNITISNSMIENILLSDSNMDTVYEINGLNVQSPYMLSFSGALSSILKTHQTKSNFLDFEHTLFDTYKHTHFFSQFLKIGLASILGILLLNFLFFNFYFEKVTALSQTCQINQTAKANIINLSEAVSKSKKTTDDMLRSNTSKSSYFISSIIASLPESILLSELIYQPLIKSIKPNKPILLNNNTIHITGESNNSDLYSDWINTLESMDWIHAVKVTDYSDSKTKTSHFSLVLTLI